MFNFSGGMLTGAEIEKQIKKGHIEITPYDPNCLNPNSYNLKLHPQLLIYKRDSNRANIISDKKVFYNTKINRGIQDPDNIEEYSEGSRICKEKDINKNFAVGFKLDTELSENSNCSEFANICNERDLLKSSITTLENNIEYLKNMPNIDSLNLPPIDMMKSNETIEFEIPKEGYVLQPGVLYIGRTVENTFTDKFIPMINGRSSGGRLGISIHICAGFGDIGFDGTWTLEITCVEPVRIYPNVPIAQVCYFKPVGKVRDLYTGRYNGQQAATASRFYK